MAYLENYLWPERGYNLKDFGILAHKMARMEYFAFYGDFPLWFIFEGKIQIVVDYLIKEKSGVY